MKILVQRLLCALVLAFGFASTSHALSLDYTGAHSTAKQFIFFFEMEETGSLEISLTSEVGDPVYLLLNTAGIPPFPTNSGTGGSLSDIIELTSGDYYLIAYTTSTTIGDLTVNLAELAPIPLPASLPLLAFALGGVAFAARRRKAAAA